MQPRTDGGPALPRRARRAIVLAAVVAVVAIGAVAFAGRRRRAPAARPNVILIVMDTTRADRCSVNGYGRDTTPNLRALAAEGTRFTAAWSAASWTLPAHGTLFTGLTPAEHQCGGGGIFHPLSPSVPTLAERLRNAGWATGCFSANPGVSSEFGLARGFDYELRRAPDDHRPEPPAGEIFAAALDFLSEQQISGRPVFAFVNLMEAHSPFNPPEQFMAPLRRGAADDAAANERELRRMAQGVMVRASFGAPRLPQAQLERLSDLYDADIANADYEIGRFLAELKSSGVADQTLVIVMSDHGEGLGDHLWIEHSMLLHQELLRIPLVMRLPERFDGGNTVKTLVGTADVYATVLDVCGIDIPSDTRGVPVDRAPEGRVAVAVEPRHDAVVPWFAALAPEADLSIALRSRRSVTDGRWHLIEENDGRATLYDLSVDPLEADNVIGTNAAEAARLRAAADR